MKLLAIIVTYLPVQEDLIKNIKSCVNDVDEIIIWENTPEHLITYNKEILAAVSDKISFWGIGTNVGIGKALNYGAEMAIEKGFSHLLTLDQDSYFDEKHLGKYKLQISQFKSNDAGIFGVNYINNNLKTFTTDKQFLEQPDCITSGSIVPVNTFLTAGFFDEELFIDGVDFDFCYRIKEKSNLKTIICSEIFLNHQVGYLTKTKLGFSTENYSAFRTYFIVKNHLLLWKRYKQLFPLFRKKHLIKNYIIYRFIKVLLAEDNKKDKMGAILRGVFDAVFKNGKTERIIE